MTLSRTCSNRKYWNEEKSSHCSRFVWWISGLIWVGDIRLTNRGTGILATFVECLQPSKRTKLILKLNTAVSPKGNSFSFQYERRPIKQMNWANLDWMEYISVSITHLKQKLKLVLLLLISRWNIDFWVLFAHYSCFTHNELQQSKVEVEVETSIIIRYSLKTLLLIC